MIRKRIFTYLIIVLINSSCFFHSKETVENHLNEILEQNWCCAADTNKKVIFKNGICKEFYKDTLINKYKYYIKVYKPEELLGYHYGQFEIIFNSIPENKEKVYDLVSTIETEVLILADTSDNYIVFYKDCIKTGYPKGFESDKCDL
ncbi:hypothetical protein [Aestuariibaculum sediminum]|uniref:Uncharacterized protein n=1 Tax=Aestuariibaculum sediminum TaxID=2770637 RepID=A0A8J6U7K4_9FLAO|nr:hypothetical protein [Aestuariibaculum sediminum]MBD0832035.1 hypothetical protein [Aestuariibaculum sediminum]